MSITIRVATPADAQAIATVYFESAEHHRDLEPDRYIIPVEATILERYRAPLAPDSTTLIAVDGDEVLGFLEARLQYPSDPMHRAAVFCHVIELGVARNRRSQGIGGQLMLAAEIWGRAAGAGFMSLEYLAVNNRAAGFYERLGFHPASVTAIKLLGPSL